MEENAYLTIKGKSIGIQRAEFECEIPLSDANYMLEVLFETPLIKKVRREIQHDDGMVWVVDEVTGENTGLVLAEIELKHTDQTFELLEWIGKEVSHDPKYYNVI